MVLMAEVVGVLEPPPTLKRTGGPSIFNQYAPPIHAKIYLPPADSLS